jgi:hypothetical protein
MLFTFEGIGMKRVVLSFELFALLTFFSGAVSAQIYVADGTRIFNVDPATGNRTELSGPGTGTGTAFVDVRGIAVQSGTTLFAVDEVVASTTMRVVQVDIATGNRTTFAETSDGNGVDWTASESLVFDEHGNLYATAGGVGLIRWALSGGTLSVNRFEVNTILPSDVHDMSVLDGAETVHITSPTQDLTQGSTFYTNFPYFLHSLLGVVGAGPAMANPKGMYRESAATLLITNFDTPSSLMRVNVLGGDRSYVSGGSPEVGTGTSFVGPIDVHTGESGDTWVLDQSLPAVIEVDLSTGDRTVVSGWDGSSTVGIGTTFSTPTSVASVVTTPATGGPDRLDASNIQGMGFKITGGVGVDVNQDFVLRTADILRVFPGPSDADIGAGSSTATIDGSFLQDTETVGLGEEDLVYGGAYAGASGALHMASSGITFDQSDAGSYVYTRFGAAGTPNTSTKSANLISVGLSTTSYLVYSYERHTPTESHDGDLYGRFLFRDGDSWFESGDFTFSGTSSAGVLTVTVHWPDIFGTYTEVDPTFGAELDNVADAGDPGFVGGSVINRGLGDTLTLTIPDPVDLGSPFSWTKDSVTLVNGGRISGADTRELVITDLMFSDAGVYVGSFDNGTRAPAVYGPVTLNVLPSLSVGWAVTSAVAISLVLLSMIVLMRRRS